MWWTWLLLHPCEQVLDKTDYRAQMRGHGLSCSNVLLRDEGESREREVKQNWAKQSVKWKKN